MLFVDDEVPLVFGVEVVVEIKHSFFQGGECVFFFWFDNSFLESA